MESFLFGSISTVWFASMLTYVFVVADGDDAIFSKDCSNEKIFVKVSPLMIILFVLCPLLLIVHSIILVKKVADLAKHDCECDQYANNLQNKNFSKLYDECYHHFKDPVNF